MLVLQICQNQQCVPAAVLNNTCDTQNNCHNHGVSQGAAGCLCLVRLSGAVPGVVRPKLAVSTGRAARGALPGAGALCLCRREEVRARPSAVNPAHPHLSRRSAITKGSAIAILAGSLPCARRKVRWMGAVTAHPQTVLRRQIPILVVAHHGRAM